MSTRYVCDNTDRRARLVARDFLAADGVTPINAIDFLEVVDAAAPDDDLRQRLLLIRFLQPLGAGALDHNDLAISGGTTITGIRALAARRLADFPAVPAGRWSGPAQAFLQIRSSELAVDDPHEPEYWLVVLVDQRGDHSRYELRLVAGVSSNETPAGFDPILSRLSFGFKIECPSEFDCEDQAPCTVAHPAAPQLDYLARDYQSFRRLMLDRLSVKLPDWQERNPADLGVTLVEMLAYAADRAAYFQDAVATEAYLGTARLRTSVRRHARLLDYRVHEGCNARAWVHLELVDGQVVAGTKDDPALRRGTRFLTALPDTPVVVSGSREAEALELGPEVFEALHGVTVLSHVHNELHLHTWGERRCVLPAGATSAALHAAREGDLVELAAGDVLVLEEVRHPETRQSADADPTRRHAVRLTAVSEPKLDVLYGVRYWEVRWHEEDALPFPLCLWEVELENIPSPVSVARGNIVLVDHGRSHVGEPLIPVEVPPDGRYRPRLPREGLTWRVPYVHDAERSATASLVQDPRRTLPAVTLREANDTWIAIDELLGSDPFSRELVVEMEADGRAYLRFGDGVLGRRPTRGVSFAADYRTGRGVTGNVGAEAIQHMVSDTLSGAVARIRNPLPATGGVDPEPLETVKLQAPEAFRMQMRAVSAEDWAEVASRHPAVQRAVATIRWTGSWHTVFLTVDPRDGRPFEGELVEDLQAFLEQFRLAGVDLELRPPAYVPIDLALVLCVAPDHYDHEVEQAARDRLTSGLRRDGSKGRFHPDNLSFGEDVHLSPIVAELMTVPGVRWVDLDPHANGSDLVRFQRLGATAAGELEAGRLPIGRLEVARLDNDPSAPDNGRLRLTLRGGR